MAIDVCSGAELVAQLHQLEALGIEVAGGSKKWAGRVGRIGVVLQQSVNAVWPIHRSKAVKKRMTVALRQRQHEFTEPRHDWGDVNADVAGDLQEIRESSRVGRGAGFGRGHSKAQLSRLRTKPCCLLVE